MLLDTKYLIKYQQKKLNFDTNQPENKKPAGYWAVLVWMLRT